MQWLQHRRRKEATSLEELESYFRQWQNRSRFDFFEAPKTDFSVGPRGTWEWPSPWPGDEAENNRARSLYWPGPRGPRAPTVLVFHALMSASDFGYRRLAQWFHRRGWNVVFPHLPYHYSRTPPGYWNGELAMTSHLIRNSRGLQQAVAEARQILQHLRGQGCETFGLLGTSYGGWVAGLLASLEPDLRFTALIQPIVDPEPAIWENPAATLIRQQIEARGVTRFHVARHREWVAPIAKAPASGHSLLTLGFYDRISPPGWIRLLANAWQAQRVVEVPQGHFGYRALPATLKALDQQGLIHP